VRKGSGFTLVEALLALAIVGAVLLAAHRVLDSSVAVRDHLEATSEAVTCVQSLSWLLSADLRGAVSAAVAGTRFEGTSREEAARGRDLLSFVTTFDPRLRRGAGLFHIRYRLRPNAGDPALWDLYRSEEPWSGNLQGEGRYEPVFRSLSRLQIEYFTGRRWVANWLQGTSAPPAVRFALSGPRVEGEAAGPHRFLIQIPCGTAAERPGDRP
jgi:hypothetical protein